MVVFILLLHFAQPQPFHTMHPFRTTVLDGFKTHGVRIVVKYDPVIPCDSITTIVREMEDAVHISVGAADEGFLVNEPFETIAGLKYHCGDTAFGGRFGFPPTGEFIG